MKKADYYKNRAVVTIPPWYKTLASRVCFPLLCLLSREQSLKLHLTPIDDERVIMALRYAKEKVLDVGCGANIFVKSYGNGIGVDVYPWEGVDQVIKNAARLPFPDRSFDTISFLACLNHIKNRDKALIEARRVLKKNGQLLITMIPPRLGAFIHWLRYKNDPDHLKRTINHSKEVLGMSDETIESLLKNAGFQLVAKKRFVFGMNTLYVAHKKTLQ